MLNDFRHKRFGKKKKESRKEKNKKKKQGGKKTKKKAQIVAIRTRTRTLSKIALYHCTTRIRCIWNVSILIFKPSLCKLVVYYLFLSAITFE